MREHTVTCLGTAFNISPGGILLTARHVLDDAYRICSEEPGSWISVLWLESGEGYDDVPDFLGGQIPIGIAQVNDSHDVAIIQLRQLLKNGEPATYPVFGLDTRIPTVGRRVLAMGYTKMDILYHENSPTKRHIKVLQAFHATDGDVVEVYPNGRDRVMLPFPAFQITARLDPGMSGGPVLSGDNGMVCGIVCTGFKLGKDGEHVSYAAMTINALGLHVSDKINDPTPRRLLDLIQAGTVIADDTAARIRIIREDAEVEVMEF
jgi:S1-C subfamily serine protease